MSKEQSQEITPEQRKEIGKILFKARLNLLGIMGKYVLGLFASNLISILIAAKILSDVDPGQQVGFQMVAMFVNFCFMAYYLHGQLKQNSDIVRSKITEVLKNNKRIRE